MACTSPLLYCIFYNKKIINQSINTLLTRAAVKLILSRFRLSQPSHLEATMEIIRILVSFFFTLREQKTCQTALRSYIYPWKPDHNLHESLNKCWCVRSERFGNVGQRLTDSLVSYTLDVSCLNSIVGVATVHVDAREGDGGSLVQLPGQGLRLVILPPHALCGTIPGWLPLSLSQLKSWVHILPSRQ